LISGRGPGHMNRARQNQPATGDQKAVCAEPLRRRSCLWALNCRYGHVARATRVSRAPDDDERVQAALAARDRELVEAREGFARDLAKQREAAERAEERLRASEKRALLEIDRERSTATKVQKELDEATRRADRKDIDHRRASEAMQAQLVDARLQAGVLLGRLDAIQAENVRLQTEVMTLREAEACARGTRPSAASAGVQKTPRPTRSSRTVPTAKPATRRKKAV